MLSFLGTHKGAVKEALHSAHLDLTITDKDAELVESDLCVKLQARLSREEVDATPAIGLGFPAQAQRISGYVE